VADALTSAPAPAQASNRGSGRFRGALAATEVDLRLFGMLIALAGILIGFHIMSGGKLIQTPC
jgi:ABC-type xylose transport system permease subunit